MATSYQLQPVHTLHDKSFETVSMAYVPVIGMYVYTKSSMIAHACIVRSYILQEIKVLSDEQLLGLANRI